MGYIILPLKINKILLVENLIQVKLKNTIINCGKLICNTSSQQSFYLAREHHFKLHNLYGYCFVCRDVTFLCVKMLLFCVSRCYCFVYRGVTVLCVKLLLCICGLRCYCFVCQDDTVFVSKCNSFVCHSVTALWQGVTVLCVEVLLFCVLRCYCFLC